MKLNRIIAFATACAACAFAQTPPNPVTFVTLNANLTQLDEKGTQWKTSWGSFQKYQASARVLEIRTSSHGDGPEDAMMHVFFIGKNDASKKWAIYDYQTKPVKIGRTADSTHVIVSAVVESSHERYAALGEEYKNGLKPNGWAIFVAKPSGMVAKLGSTHEAAEWTLGYLREHPEIMKRR